MAAFISPIERFKYIKLLAEECYAVNGCCGTATEAHRTYRVVMREVLKKVCGCREVRDVT
jgi:hypothetical protein